MCNWFELLRQAIADSSKAQVARELKVSRTAISLIISGKYLGSTKNMEQRILAKYNKILCPQHNQEINIDECIEKIRAAMPTSNPNALRMWRICKTCEHNRS